MFLEKERHEPAFERRRDHLAEVVIPLVGTGARDRARIGGVRIGAGAAVVEHHRPGRLDILIVPGGDVQLA